MSLSVSSPPRETATSQLSPSQLKEQILRLTRQFSRAAHLANRPGFERSEDPALQRSFVPGQTPVPYAGRVFTEDEVEAAVAATLDFWLTFGEGGEAFGQGFS